MSGGDAVKDGVDKLAIHDDDDIESNYKPPPEKTIEELLNADKEDASLQKYKEKLLGGVASSGKIIFGKQFFFFLYLAQSCYDYWARTDRNLFTVVTLPNGEA